MGFLSLTLLRKEKAGRGLGRRKGKREVRLEKGIERKK